jgi:ankyrin repeat protein
MDTDPPTPLMLACAHGNLSAVKQFEPGVVTKQVNLEGTAVYPHARSTPLIAAIASNQPDLVSYLLECAADPNIGVFHGIFPLGVAAEQGNVTICYNLLTAGALHTPAVGLVLNPIQFAVRAGHVEVAELLLAFGADLHCTTADGTGLAILAARGGHAIMITCLVGAGINVNVWRSGGTFLDGWAPLDVAANNGHLRAVETLLGCKADPNLVIDTGRRRICQISPLIQAIRNDRVDIVQALLFGGADPDDWAPDFFHCTTPSPLIVAARVGNIPIAKLLLEYSASIDESSCNQNPLIASTYAGNTDMTRFLVERGADVNLQAPSGGATAIYYAAEQGHIKPLKVLLTAGASPDETIYRPPIFAAVQNNQIDAALLLAIWGANVKIRDLNAVAHRTGSPTVSVIFKNITPRNQPAWPPLVIAIASRSVRECRLALKYGAIDPDAAGPQSIQLAKNVCSPNPWGPINVTAEMSKFSTYFVDHENHPERRTLERLGNVPTCPETTKFMRLATRGWRIPTHGLHHSGFREMVRFVLMLAARLETAEKGNCFTLPLELWLLIPTLLSRSCISNTYTFK